MGRNFKERAAYVYLHGMKSQIPRKLLYSLKRKWWRHNYDIGDMRLKRNNKRAKETKNNLKHSNL